jgi:hypothetical protein
VKELILIEPVQAHRALSALFANDIKAQTMAGQRLKLTLEIAEDERTLKQNAFLWGFVYKHISEQAQIAGIGAIAEGWHVFYKRMHLGYRFRKTLLPGKKRPSVIRELRSTKGLKVKAMSDYLDKVMAHAATTFGVAFPAGVTWESYREDRK